MLYPRYFRRPAGQNFKSVFRPAVAPHSLKNPRGGAVPEMRGDRVRVCKGETGLGREAVDGGRIHVCVFQHPDQDPVLKRHRQSVCQRGEEARGEEAISGFR